MREESGLERWLTGHWKQKWNGSHFISSVMTKDSPECWMWTPLPHPGVILAYLHPRWMCGSSLNVTITKGSDLPLPALTSGGSLTQALRVPAVSLNANAPLVSETLWLTCYSRHTFSVSCSWAPTCMKSEPPRKHSSGLVFQMQFTEVCPSVAEESILPPEISQRQLSRTR